MPQYRCPNVVVSRDDLAMVSAIALVENGVLPCDGGWDDQAATFVQAHPIVASRIAHEREAASKRAFSKQPKNKR